MKNPDLIFINRAEKNFDLLFSTPILMDGFSGITSTNYKKSLQYRELFQRNSIAGIFNIKTSIDYLTKE